ncbi:alkaline phosphatase, tissue-nonspecific isozyme-like isoform X2 [Mizuhopecten yessoensis]|uniref:alkaline phosphatase n=1 Tax=Mizuhopecten yessoensis TaxID=6573 RepID=A0A210PTM3_MIZYE|nr:alkaline phosphatase, tissue-nonspecific isozyme-like isoform X2 [Mizuhopecten yessoensis]OWF39849.1 Alkaline phosphatase, tissue-nonspecific isozyme [Mizuhopecten yessoensis]
MDLLDFSVVLLCLMTGSCKSQPQQFWNDMAQNDMRKAMKFQPNTNVAKNVILFIGDGMSISTITAARIRRGQLQGRTGEETVLKFEEFPHVGLLKTYPVDRQTADSASTATALLSGVKTKYYLVGLDATAKRGDCASAKGARLKTMVDWAEEEGKSTGIVTTTRLTHATPSSAYAHSVDRDWEGDVNMDDKTGKCRDVAHQFVFENRNIEVAFGGGRRHFIPYDVADPEANFTYAKYQRRDNRNLIDCWKFLQDEDGKRFKYVWNKQQFDDIDPDNVDNVLGLFAPSHMQYEMERDDGPQGEPSLTEMTTKAIKILQKNDKGFFLMVEGGRIDHAHHDNKAKKALHETLALEDAVREAVRLTDEEDTMIVVTADHSHVFSLGGYPSRGNDILAAVDDVPEQYLPPDRKGFTTITYGNGPGFEGGNRTDPRYIDTTTDDYVFPSAVPLGQDTHGADDVAVYARGPMSHLIHGVHEQNYVAHVMAYASCIGINKAHCAHYRVINTGPIHTPHSGLLLVVIACILLLNIRL